MNTIKDVTRKAYLPMVLMNDGDLDSINNSNLNEGMRDIAVYFMMSKCLLDMGTHCLWWADDEDLKPLLKFLNDKGNTDMINIINNRSK